MQSAFVTRRSASRTGSLLGDVLGGHAGRPVAVVAVLERTWASSRPLLEALERHPPSAGGVRRRTCSAPPDAPPAEACEGGGITWLMDYTVFAASATGSERAASYKQMLALHHSGGAGKGAPCVLVVPLQVDVLPASIVDEVAYMADAVIDVRQAEEAHLGCQPARPILASVTVRRPGGKSESQMCQMDAESGACTRVDAGRAAEGSKGSDAGARAVPRSTFNLDTTPAQEQARAALLLPHLRAQEAARPNGAGQAILADDYDEDDPDDDLDV